MPAAAFIIKQGDTLPALEAILSDDNGPVSLAGATVQFAVRPVGCGNVTRFIKPAIVVGSQDVGSPTRGKVRYEWAAEDTADVGAFIGEFKVTFGASGTWTFPTVGSINIQVSQGIVSP